MSGQVFILVRFRKRCRIFEFSALYYRVSIAQDHPTRRYHISIRSLTTEVQEPNQRCTPDANRWECVSDRRVGRTDTAAAGTPGIPRTKTTGSYRINLVTIRSL